MMAFHVNIELTPVPKDDPLELRPETMCAKIVARRATVFRLDELLRSLECSLVGRGV
jgi:hypothetical protein